MHGAWLCVCLVLVRVAKKVLKDLITSVMIYDVKANVRGLKVYSRTTKSLVRFRPSKPLLQQMSLHTLALVYAVCKWFYKRDESKHSKGGK